MKHYHSVSLALTVQAILLANTNVLTYLLTRPYGPCLNFVCMRLELFLGLCNQYSVADRKRPVASIPQTAWSHSPIPVWAGHPN